ncbi:MAG: enolase C-terminal domain-like protein, partial [Chloroflexota bacterium]|nr:enolase C-terminal domain-like protein [Chloroflexota bacterium]
TLGDFLPYFHHKSADVIQVSSGIGGITTAMRLADAAYGFELPITLGGSFGHVHAHMAPSIPNFMIMEITQEEPDPCITWDVTFENGHAVPGNKPGIGVEINRDVLENIKVEKTTPGTQSSPFGRRPGAGLYQVAPSKEERANSERLNK